MQEILKDSKYKELLQDSEVQSYLKDAEQSLQEQLNSLNDYPPFKEESLELYKRRLVETKGKEDLNADIESFDRFNPNMKGILKSLQAQKPKRKKKWWEKYGADSEKGTDSKNGDTLDDRRIFAQNSWEQILEQKKAAWLKHEQDKKQRDYQNRIKEYLESLLDMQKFLDELGEAKELFGDSMGEMKQSLDVSNLGDESYMKKLEGQKGDRLGDLGGDNAKGRGGSSYGDHYGSRSNIDINKIKQYFAALQNNKGLKEIAELLGRIEAEEKKSKTIQIKEMKSYSYTQVLPTKRYKEEVCGVTLGRDLENLLPQELALLDDPDLEILFDLKYIQNRLFCFEKQGYYSIMREAQEEIEREEEIEEDKKREKNEGAIIICVDTSGSMSGTPEFIAKALSLYLATKANTQKRSCYLINFSVGIESMELSGKGGMAKLMRFLSLSFGGGTDVAPALKHGVKKMQDEDFKKSDLIVISDGAFGHIDSTLQQSMKTQREKKNKFYLLDINGNSGQKSFFDKHWHYDSSGNIRELYSKFKDIAHEG